MTYDEVMDPETIVTRDEARFEIEAHGCDWLAFVADCGEREDYRSVDVMHWLGY